MFDNLKLTEKKKVIFGKIIFKLSANAKNYKYSFRPPVLK